MGLLDRLFNSDPQAILERAEGLLDRGDAAGALKALRRTERGSLAQDNRFATLRRRAHDDLLATALDRARVSEEAGYLEDAAEWIRSGLDHAPDSGRRDELERRAEALDELADAEATRQSLERARNVGEALPPGGANGAESAAGDGELDPDSHYEMLVGMFDDDVAERYNNRPEAFRLAFLDLMEGRTETAREALEELVERHPEDPVYRLEAGRCRLNLGDAETARQDFEAVWEAFGDEPLDLAGTLSVPSLWAEAMLVLRQPDALVQRLDGVAEPEAGDGELCYHFALGLLMAERYDDAEPYLLGAMEHFPRDPRFPQQLAAALHGADRTDDAILALERAIAPSCAGGQCNSPPLHAPSLRSLAGLYLEQGEARLDRVEELLHLVARSQGGQLSGEDYLLLAELHQRQGHEEAAREAAESARRLRDAATPERVATEAAPLAAPKSSILSLGATVGAGSLLGQLGAVDGADA